MVQEPIVGVAGNVVVTVNYDDQQLRPGLHSVMMDATTD